MSQYPPPPPGMMPPTGMMGPPPGMAGMPGMPQPKQSNGAAIGSLICGILGCVPVITSLCAVILGFVGISKAKDPRVGGKAMAIIGLLLGIVGLIGWSAGGYGIYRGYAFLKELILPSSQFFEALGNGDVAKAQSVSTANVSTADIENGIAVFKTMGKFQRIDSGNGARTVENGTVRYTYAGTEVFANGSKKFTFALKKEGDVYKIDAFKLE